MKSKKGKYISSNPFEKAITFTKTGSNNHHNIYRISNIPSTADKINPTYYLVPSEVEMIIDKINDNEKNKNKESKGFRLDFYG